MRNSGGIRRTRDAGAEARRRDRGDARSVVVAFAASAAALAVVAFLLVREDPPVRPMARPAGSAAGAGGAPTPSPDAREDAASARVEKTQPPDPPPAQPGPAETEEPRPREANALVNGSFEDVDAEGRPTGWKLFDAAKINLASDGEGKWIRLKNGGMAEQMIALDPAWDRLKVSARMRVKGLVLGEKPWQCFRIALRFDDAAGKAIKYPAMPELKADSGWTTREVEIEIPKADGAKRLSVQVALFGKAGVCEADDVTVMPLAGPGEGALAADAPAGDAGKPRIVDVFLRTSVRRRRVAVDVELDAVREAGEASLTVAMLDGAGREERRFAAKVALEAAGRQTLTVEWDWPDPRLWDLGRPELYTARVAVSGAGVEAEYSQGFGFREFWIEGRDFYLNGTKVRFRPQVTSYWKPRDVADAERRVEGMMEHGFNLTEVWPDKGDYARMNDVLGTACDRKGFAMTGVTPHSSRFGSWSDPGTRRGFRRELEKFIRKARNHPSILMWGSSANRHIDGRDQDPRNFGRRGWIVDLETEERFRTGIEVLEAVKAYDPTRPVFSHAGGFVGDVYTLNNYLCFLPLQEREEWLSEWATSGTMPLLMVEFGTPLLTTYLRGRMGYGEVLPTEPLATEWHAAYFGTEAYTKETPEYREAVRSRFKGGMRYRPWREGGWVKAFVNSPAVVETQALFMKNTWRAWRTWGIPGGMVPWEDGSHHLELLKAHNGPSLAWIAGPEDAFIDKAHNFRAGERVRKSVVLANDHRAPRDYSLEWRVEVDGTAAAKGSRRGRLGVSETLFIPIEFRAPRVPSKGRPGRIVLAAKIGPDEHADEFAIRVVGPAITKGFRQLSIWDPVGETKAMLAELGVAASDLREGDVSIPKGTVVVGRKVLSDMHWIPFDVERFVRGGGRLLVMAQDPKWMRRGLGLRTAEYLARRAFRVALSGPDMPSMGPGAVGSHPVFEGLDDYALSDWAGSSRLAPERSTFEGLDPWWCAMYGFHWGNRGAVSSAPVEKPHRTSWRPLAECEFDLAYSPLMEMEYGAGRVTLCTFDLEDHVGNDAAARRLAYQVLAHVATARIRSKAERVNYVGEQSGSKRLEAMGVVHEPLLSLDPRADLVIVGPGGSEEGLEGYARKGGRVLFMRRETAALGVGVKKVSGFAGSTAPPAWPETAGLSASDLRWRSTHEAWVLEEGPAIEVEADGLLGRMKVGKGVIVFCQVDPGALPADEKTYLRYTRWRQTRALAQILSNMGATFKQDRRQMELLQRPEHPVYLEGTWKAKLTRPIPERHPRKANPDPGWTDEARLFVKADASDREADKGMQDVRLPQYMEGLGPAWKGMDGEAVFRKVIELPPWFEGRDLVVSLGRVDESETTFFNGEKVGESSHWMKPRRHVIPGRLVRPGRNVVAVRTYDAMIHGGMCADPARFYVEPRSEPTRFYHDDYRDSWELDGFKEGDDPYRYYRW